MLLERIEKVGPTIIEDRLLPRSLMRDLVGVTSIIGPNGAGKSTLFGVVGRLLAPDAGHVTIDGLPAASAPPGELARRIALLRQDNHLTARLTGGGCVEAA